LSKRPWHPGRRQDAPQASPDSLSAESQPGLPTGSARLLAVRREGETVWLQVDLGAGGSAIYEVAAASLPGDLPPPGGELDAAGHRSLALAAERKRAARSLFALLDRKLRPVAKLRERLLDEGYHPEAVGAVIEAMLEQGVHSDRRYAEAWCRDCLLSRAVGPRYLERKLREAGIAPDLARQASIDAVGPDTEVDLARSAATARWRRIGGTEPRDVARVVRFLLGRGFGPGTAARMARQTKPDAGSRSGSARDGADDGDEADET
jgi:regulatory protein